MRKLLWIVSILFAAICAPAAYADNYNLVSNWHTGAAQFGNLDTYTGNGTFTWNGSTFSNIVFTFTDPDDGTLWTATPTDGELLSGNTLVIIGNGSADCNGASCVGITFGSAVTTGSPQTLNGVSGFSQGPNTTFDSAILTDISAVPEPGAFVLTLTGVGSLGLLVVMRKRIA
jgi:hypothetical protein